MADEGGVFPYEGVVPTMTDSEHAELRADIESVGRAIVPIVLDTDGYVIDGHNRFRICEELGLPEPEAQVEDVTGAEARSLARRLNLKRRQLTREQKRKLIEDELRERPERSNRQVAKDLGASHVTVGDVRGELESTGQIDQLDKTVGADGRERPASKSHAELPAEREQAEPEPIQEEEDDQPLTSASAPATNPLRGSRWQRDHREKLAHLIEGIRGVASAAGSIDLGEVDVDADTRQEWVNELARAASVLGTLKRELANGG